jgi:PAS domain S-box-containing protein
LVEARTVELKASEESYRALVNNLTDVVFTIDLKGNFTFCSQAGEKMTSYPVQQLLSMNMKEVIAQEHLAEIQERLQARIRGEKKLPPHEFEIIKADGKRLPVEMSTTPLAKKGSLVGIQGIARDITERKRIEKEFQAASRYARGLIEASLDPLVTISPDGKITDVNKATELVTEFTRDQLVGTDFSNYFAEAEKAKQGYREVFSKGFVKDYALAIRSKSGKVTDVLYNATSFKDETGKTQGVFAAARDITERKEMERLREQATTTLIEDAIRRKELEKMRNQFISAVTHELRTPLVSIKGYVDLILEGSESMTESVQSNLHVVKRNTDRLLSLVNDLLDLSRMQAGRLELELQPVDFKTVIQSCMAEAKPLIEEKKLSVGMEVPDKSLQIQGDQVRLCQVLMNLLSNAIKFSPEGSDVTLRVKEEMDIVKVEVSDKGIGIRKENLARVFEPFSAIEKPTYVKGTGLGLSITKGLVEAHGGKIWAESEGEGKGATFSFTIPKRKEMV